MLTSAYLPPPPLPSMNSHSPPVQPITSRRRHALALIRHSSLIPVTEELEEVSETRREEVVHGRPGEPELGANRGGRADFVSTGSAAVATAPSMRLQVGVRRLRLVHRPSGAPEMWRRTVTTTHSSPSSHRATAAAVPSSPGCPRLLVLVISPTDRDVSIGGTCRSLHRDQAITILSFPEAKPKS